MKLLKMSRLCLMFSTKPKSIVVGLENSKTMMPFVVFERKPEALFLYFFNWASYAKSCNHFSLSRTLYSHLNHLLYQRQRRILQN